jgi:hypothetical protein
MGGVCNIMFRNEKRKQNSGLKTEGNVIFFRYGDKWEDNIKMDIREIEYKYVGWIHLN